MKMKTSIHLSSIQQISDATAEILGMLCDNLHLNSLTALSLKAAESLGKLRGAILSLNGLESISDIGISFLAKNEKLTTSGDVRRRIDAHRKKPKQDIFSRIKKQLDWDLILLQFLIKR